MWSGEIGDLEEICGVVAYKLCVSFMVFASLTLLLVCSMEAREGVLGGGV